MAASGMEISRLANVPEFDQRPAFRGATETANLQGRNFLRLLFVLILYLGQALGVTVGACLTQNSFIGTPFI